MNVDPEGKQRAGQEHRDEDQRDFDRSEGSNSSSEARAHEAAARKEYPVPRNVWMSFTGSPLSSFARKKET